jgi:hypothetical protein
MRFDEYPLFEDRLAAESTKSLVLDAMFYVKSGGIDRDTINRYFVESLPLLRSLRVQFIFAISPKQNRQPAYDPETVARELARRSHAKHGAKS